MENSKLRRFWRRLWYAASPIIIGVGITLAVIAAMQMWNAETVLICVVGACAVSLAAFPLLYWRWKEYR